MPDRKLIPNSFLKEHAPRVPIVIAGLFSFWLMRENLYAGLGVLAVAIVAGFFVERLQSRLKCPECGEQTSPQKKTREPGAAIEFYCRKCKLIWDTGRSYSRGVSSDKHWE